MTVKYIEDGKIATVLPKLPFFISIRNKLEPADYFKMVSFINNSLDEALQQPDGFIVPSWIPKQKFWEDSIWMPIYSLTQDEEAAGFFLGLLGFHVVMERPEVWCSGKTIYTGHLKERRYYFKEKK